MEYDMSWDDSNFEEYEKSTQREHYKGLAARFADKGGDGSKLRETTSYAASTHPAVRADRVEIPQTREYGYSAPRRNDEMAEQSFKTIKAMLDAVTYEEREGLKPILLNEQQYLAMVMRS